MFFHYIFLNGPHSFHLPKTTISSRNGKTVIALIAVTCRAWHNFCAFLFVPHPDETRRLAGKTSGGKSSSGRYLFPIIFFALRRANRGPEENNGQITQRIRTVSVIRPGISMFVPRLPSQISQDKGTARAPYITEKNVQNIFQFIGVFSLPIISAISIPAPV